MPKALALVWIGIFWLGLLLIAGCSDDGTEVLTPEIAKKTLREIKIPPGVIIPWPEDEKVEVLNNEEIKIGFYKCNLRKKTFNATAINPNAFRHKSNQVMGVFERTPEGNWIAKVTYSASSH